jgi:hypothetical protein
MQRPGPRGPGRGFPVVLGLQSLPDVDPGRVLNVRMIFSKVGSRWANSLGYVVKLTTQSVEPSLLSR